MLEKAHSVVVLLTPRHDNRLIVVSLAGGDAEDVLMTARGALVVQPGVGVVGLHHEHVVGQQPPRDDEGGQECLRAGVHGVLMVRSQAPTARSRS